MRLLLALCLGAQSVSAAVAPVRFNAPIIVPAGVSAAGASAVGRGLGNLTLSPGLSSAPLPLAPLPLPSSLSVAAMPAAVGVAASPMALDASAAIPERLAEISLQVGTDLGNLPSLSGEASRDTGENHIRLLMGEKPVSPTADAILGKPSEAAPLAPSQAASPRAPAPEPQDLVKAKAVKLMMWGTPAFKLGAEVVTLSIPLLALQTLGGVTHVAALVVFYQVAQAVFGSLTSSLTDRFPASKVLSASILAQGVLIGGLLTVSALGLFSPWMLYPAYALIGGAIGIADTARKSIPALILGHDQQELIGYNARLHRRYEVAGVIGAVAGGLLLGLLGPMYAMILQPPAYIASAFLFWKISHPQAQAPETSPSSAGVKGWLSGYWGDLKTGFSIIGADRRFRWLAAAMILPLIVHRVFESLLLPVYAKTVLGAGALSAVLLASSNLGELGGASVLLRWSKKHPGPAVWVRWAGYGLLASWILSAVAGLPLWASLSLLIPGIFLFSLSWAQSQLSLETDIQERVSKRDQPRVLSVLNALFILGTAAVSFGLGRFLDWLPVSSAFLWINAGCTALAVLVWLASKRLKP